MTEQELFLSALSENSLFSEEEKQGIKAVSATMLPAQIRLLTKVLDAHSKAELEEDLVERNEMQERLKNDFELLVQKHVKEFYVEEEKKLVNEELEEEEDLLKKLDTL